MKTKLALAAALMTATFSTQAFAFPDRPIQVIVPYSAGGGTDLSLRLLAESFERNFDGATMVVRNQPGGGGSIGTSGAVESRPDGYTLGAGAQGPLALLPHLGGTTYQIENVEFIGLFGRNLQVMVACKDAPFDNFDAFLEYAKTKAPQIGNSGAGGANHVSAEAFAKAANIKIESVPFGGSSEARTACVGGHIDAMVASPAEALAQVEAGNVSPLFVMEPERIDLFPDTPTAVEKGIDFTWSSWKGLIGPKGIPAEDLKFLRDALKTTVEDEEFKAKMAEMGEFVIYEDAEQYEARARSDSKVAEAVIRDLGMYGMNN
ncbi:MULTISPECIES: tripartite tricarboxylate transporter substrate binding protein [Thalassospira]|uniref:Bug family tripartite tricarboxylate transporter substrate binding protein n=1 Tax=Thalassospira TaxID=168934 RepID=UPI000C096D34|nr:MULTISPECIES: tripartite tricarboxylate transporter substrate binding protein [Thalassospira]MAC33261.1 C4-dicarboxylate ABC transporter substrate-binding protein [Haliea sp.]MBR9782022.1 tripartite tricarboxylate transporter substrate binding protein [Rhodospirillales bacterium]MBR9816754.1 tripartite tricarboxylate transporter substrate binding protein [Rhodospirillales bacterium]HBS21696.1 tripartite tricarboxylate transporter substrate binding protein [Thalassospira sp.]|tara:strand:+ start:1004 stop:1960 length:957 start_codon:yes stop_codon:yes gene_type:complete